MIAPLPDYAAAAFDRPVTHADVTEFFARSGVKWNRVSRATGIHFKRVRLLLSPEGVTQKADWREIWNTIRHLQEARFPPSGRERRHSNETIVRHLAILLKLNHAGIRSCYITQHLPTGYQSQTYYSRDVWDAGLVTCYPHIEITEKGREFLRRHSISVLEIATPAKAA